MGGILHPRTHAAYGVTAKSASWRRPGLGEMGVMGIIGVMGWMGVMGVMGWMGMIGKE